MVNAKAKTKTHAEWLAEFDTLSFDVSRMMSREPFCIDSDKRSTALTDIASRLRRTADQIDPFVKSWKRTS